MDNEQCIMCEYIIDGSTVTYDTLLNIPTEVHITTIKKIVEEFPRFCDSLNINYISEVYIHYYKYISKIGILINNNNKTTKLEDDYGIIHIIMEFKMHNVDKSITYKDVLLALISKKIKNPIFTRPHNDFCTVLEDTHKYIINSNHMNEDVLKKYGYTEHFNKLNEYIKQNDNKYVFKNELYTYDELLCVYNELCVHNNSVELINFKQYSIEHKMNDSCFYILQNKLEQIMLLNLEQVINNNKMVNINLKNELVNITLKNELEQVINNNKIVNINLKNELEQLKNNINLLFNESNINNIIIACLLSLHIIILYIY